MVSEFICGCRFRRSVECSLSNEMGPTRNASCFTTALPRKDTAKRHFPRRGEAESRYTVRDSSPAPLELCSDTLPLSYPAGIFTSLITSVSAVNCLISESIVESMVNSLD